MNASLVKTWASCMPDASSMMIAADAFADDGDTKMEMLLRMYANNLTEIGTFKFDELQKEFNIAPIERGNGYYFINLLGYFYTELHVNYEILINNPSLMEQQPIRNLYITNMSNIHQRDFCTLLGTYRFGYLKNLILNFHRCRSFNLSVEQFIANINGIQLETLILDYVDNVNRRLELAFSMNNRIKKGCRLILNNSLVQTKN